MRGGPKAVWNFSDNYPIWRSHSSLSRVYSKQSCTSLLTVKIRCDLLPDLAHVGIIGHASVHHQVVSIKDAKVCPSQGMGTSVQLGQAKAHKVVGTRFLGRGPPSAKLPPTFPNKQPDHGGRRRLIPTANCTTCVSRSNTMCGSGAKWQVRITRGSTTKSAQTLGNPLSHAATPCTRFGRAQFLKNKDRI